MTACAEVRGPRAGLFDRGTAEVLARRYAAGEGSTFSHTDSCVRYVLRRGLLEVERLKGCAWDTVRMLYVSGVEAGEQGLAVATRLPDEEETPGPTILLPYVAEEERPFPRKRF